VKEPLGRPRHKCEDNIEMGFKDVRVSTALIWFRIGTNGGLL
jgi:hypothetical protein